jgi:hypothetical protein
VERSYGEVAALRAAVQDVSVPPASLHELTI